MVCRFRVLFLLVLLTSIAFTLGCMRYFDWHVRSIVFVATLWITTGYMGRILSERINVVTRDRFFLTGLSFVLINWILWFLIYKSLGLIQHVCQTPIPEGLKVMLAAHTNGVFLIFAEFSTALVAFALYKRLPRLLNHTGILSIAVWFVVILFGFLLACACIGNFN